MQYSILQRFAAPKVFWKHPRYILPVLFRYLKSSVQVPCLKKINVSGFQYQIFVYHEHGET
jgi:hypothetical protein